MIREEYDPRRVIAAEIAGMTTSEKIRHYRICASAARMAAGPMWRNGQPVERADMPREWHDKIAEAEMHEATIRRLEARNMGGDGGRAMAQAAAFRASPDPRKLGGQRQAWVPSDGGVTDAMRSLMAKKPA